MAKEWRVTFRDTSNKNKDGVTRIDKSKNRSITDCGLFKNKAEAQAYAKAISTHMKGSTPRLVQRPKGECKA